MEQTFAVGKSSVRSLVARVAPVGRHRVTSSPLSHSVSSPVGQGRVEAEELLVLRGVVSRVTDGRRAAAVVRRDGASLPLGALRGPAGPAATGLAGVTADPHQGEALVAGVESRVLEMSPSQTHLTVVRVGQLRTLSLGSDTGETTEAVTEAEFLLVVTVPVLPTFLHAAHPSRRHGELVPGGTELLSLYISEAVLGETEQESPSQHHLSLTGPQWPPVSQSVSGSNYQCLSSRQQQPTINTSGMRSCKLILFYLNISLHVLQGKLTCPSNHIGIKNCYSETG